MVDLDEKEEKLLNVALNKIKGQWDYSRLEEIFQPCLSLCRRHLTLIRESQTAEPRLPALGQPADDLSCIEMQPQNV